MTYSYDFSVAALLVTIWDGHWACSAREVESYWHEASRVYLYHAVWDLTLPSSYVVIYPKVYTVPDKK